MSNLRIFPSCLYKMYFIHKDPLIFFLFFLLILFFVFSLIHSFTFIFHVPILFSLRFDSFHFIYSFFIQFPSHIHSCKSPVSFFSLLFLFRYSFLISTHWPSGLSVCQWSGRPKFKPRSRHAKDFKNGT